ncbi:hypothetical protein C8Q76DRAFT_794915 [Earliella scabrosa]|nr:hypothetical protein C8Q76DRAFT_794915 [Earliella scabrosa]
MADAAKGMHKAARGGNKLIAGGVAAVAAGFGLFWYAQKSYQTKKETSSHPGAVPTWEYRLAQQPVEPSNPPQQEPTKRSVSKEDVPSGPKSVPTTGNTDQRESKGSAYLSSTQGKSTDEGKQDAEPTAQREKEAGTGEIASKKQGGPGFDQKRHGSDKK